MATTTQWQNNQGDYPLGKISCVQIWDNDFRDVELFHGPFSLKRKKKNQEEKRKKSLKIGQCDAEVFLNCLNNLTRYFNACDGVRSDSITHKKKHEPKFRCK